MKQVTLRLRDGRVEVLDVPPPSLTPDGVLIDVRASVLSVGTERSKVEAGREGLIGKARARPDQARQVVEKARRDGIRETIQAVRMRLDQPAALGYSAAGVVLEVGQRVRALTPGDRVACGGGEQAVHADIVQVPGNLCVPLPDGVDFESGAFATVASVAMHGVRQANIKLGERVAVIGLGLVGQLTGQIARAAGCHVMGIDLAGPLLDKARELASVDLGYERSALEVRVPAEARECDAVIITAASRSSDPVELAPRLLRDRGRVVVVGDVNVDVPRAPYYAGEIEVRFSRSYGPGRYDREYEERGLDYPIGYVRWTEQRNMAAFLELVASGRVNLSGLILDRVAVEKATDAYERLVSASASPLGVVLQYGATLPEETHLAVSPRRQVSAAPRIGRASVIGAGSFAQRVLIPGLKQAGFELHAIASARGLSAKASADRFGFARTLRPEEAIADPESGLVAIATRHASHATLAEAALRAGKPVFVEKPPCLSQEELAALRAARAASAQPLYVGFNRRHAPLAIELREHVRAADAPIELLYRVNADRLGPDHWLNDPDEGGGRLLGEGCHFVDFACWLVGDRPVRTGCVLAVGPGEPESFAVTLGFANGSVASILYAVGGASGVAKEHVEAHSAGRSGRLDDYRRLFLHQGQRKRTTRQRRQDKGHSAQFAAILSTTTTTVHALEPDPLASMAATLGALEVARSGAASRG